MSESLSLLAVEKAPNFRSAIWAALVSLSSRSTRPFLPSPLSVHPENPFLHELPPPTPSIPLISLAPASVRNIIWLRGRDSFLANEVK